MHKSIQVVDLFAGPGGLGEGFNSVRDEQGERVFKTLVSVEKEVSAHKTLTLRAFYRLLLDSGKGMAPYFDYLNGGEHPQNREDVRHFWLDAEQEALRLELGGEDGNGTLENILKKELDQTQDWVLIGGPPCQAYSVVGRVRNLGVKDYRPEEDKRHFLYREYLDVIARHRPGVFVMENVRGMLTSKVGKKRIFGQILEDLHDPTNATGHEGPSNIASGQGGYTIFSLEDSSVYFPKTAGLFDSKVTLEEGEYSSFVVKTEDHGIPQARHRVILVGVRNDIVARRGGAPSTAKFLEMEKTTVKSACGHGAQVSAKRVLDPLPELRSGLSRHDGDEAWYSTVMRVARKVADQLLEVPSEHVDYDTRRKISNMLQDISENPMLGLSRKYTHKPELNIVAPAGIDEWYHGAQDANTKGFWYNHEARSHMEEDLARYLYCAVFAKVVGYSPIGEKEIYLDYLAPMHVNWKSGKFADRFKVVVEDKPSKTITSHISKDGHYYIHYDPLQCRSLTVREAARLQTFPDDYFFEGNKTQQYVQVGNAVPPLLARKIAQKVSNILKNVSG